MAKLREKAAALEAEMAKEIDRIKRSGEIVPYGKYDADGIRAGRGSQALDLPLAAVEQRHRAPVRGDAVDLNLTAADHEVGVDLGVVEELALRRVLRQVLDRPAEPGAVRDVRDRVLVEERVEEDEPGGLDLR